MSYLLNRLWFISELNLVNLCQILEIELQLQEFEFDMENLYEWAEAEAQDNSWKINISRKHREGDPLPDEFYHILFAGQPPDLNIIAQQIATIIKVPVNLGSIIYLGGDDYDYKVIQQFINKENPLEQ